VLDIFLHKTAIIEITKNLTERGYTIYLFAMYSKRKYKFKNSKIHIIQIPLRYIPIISPILFTGSLLLILPFYIMYINPDFIVTGPGLSFLGFIWTPILSRLRHVKNVLDIRSTPVYPEGIRGYLRVLAFNISVLYAKSFFNGITIITAPMKREICKKFLIDPGFIGVWTSGVSEDLFDPNKFISEAAELREKMGLADKFIIFHHGNLAFKRGIVECIKSIKIIKNKYIDIVLFLLERLLPKK